MDVEEFAKDVRRRPALPRAPLPNEVVDFEPDVLFQLDEKLYGKNLQSSRGVWQKDFKDDERSSETTTL